MIRTALRSRLAGLTGAIASLLFAGCALAHGIEGADQEFLLSNVGPNIGPYLYLGAKHMVTGYDHLLFLAGVIFFLYRLRDVALYVTLFAVGHSATLLIGVLGGFTTYSTFGYETFALLRDADYLRAFGNVITHVVLGLAFVWLGYVLVSR